MPKLSPLKVGPGCQPSLERAGAGRPACWWRELSQGAVVGPAAASQARVRVHVTGLWAAPGVSEGWWRACALQPAAQNWGCFASQLRVVGALPCTPPPEDITRGLQPGLRRSRQQAMWPREDTGGLRAAPGEDLVVARAVTPALALSMGGLVRPVPSVGSKQPFTAAAGTFPSAVVGPCGFPGGMRV